MNDADFIRRLKQTIGSGAELWLVDLDEYARHASLDGLSADDHARAARMAFERDALRLLARRHALRRVLATALNCSPSKLVIEPDHNGKPRLQSHPALQFNLSHSEHVCLIGLSTRHPVGIDVEIVRRIADADQLARSCLTVREYQQWSSVSARSELSLLSCWTRKEACLKALGVGLAVNPGDFEAGWEHHVDRVSVVLENLKRTVVVYPVVLEFNAVAAVAHAALKDDAIADVFVPSASAGGRERHEARSL